MNQLIVIAEAGVNHNGDMARARDMIAAAAAAGADYVKFQAFCAADLVAAGTGTAAYQARNTGEGDQVALLRSCELPSEAYVGLAAHCRDCGIGFLCTAFDEQQIDQLIAAGMDSIKIASGELTNTPALRSFALTGLPILLSTGMANLEEVGEAVETLQDAGANDLTLLHCTSLYPAPIETLNLKAMVTMADHFSLPVGYSDHSLGDQAAIAAVALGAVVVEKHFTLDRNLPGPDHAASLEPNELASMIRKLRETKVALGDGEKRPAEGEEAVARLIRRSWHAARDLGADHVLGERDAILKRPCDGLPPGQSPLGARLKVGVTADTAIRAGHIDRGNVR